MSRIPLIEESEHPELAPLIAKIKAERGGRFLFPSQEGEERIPSLVSVARAAAVRVDKEEGAAHGGNGTAGGPATKDTVSPA